MFNEDDIRHKALVDASRLAGGVTALVQLVKARNKGYSKKFQITREQMNNWINRKDERLPYDRLVDISCVTGVHMDCLAPGNPTNKNIISPKKLLFLKTPVEDILMSNPQCLREIEEDRPVIIDTTGMIITGLARVEAYKASRIKYITVEVVDLKAVILEIQKTEFCNIQKIKNIDLFLPLEQIYIGLRLNQLIGSRQGQRNDLL